MTDAGRVDGAGAVHPLTAGEALALAGDAPRQTPWLIVSDFDGTLSPLVMDPWGATIVPLARRALRRLAGRPATTVVLLSGRTAADLAARVRVGGARYLGNHGLETGTLARYAPAARLRPGPPNGFAAYEAEATGIAAAMPLLVPEPWLVVEAKSPAVGLHFRSATDLPAAAARVAAAVERLDPEARFERISGLRMLELRPPGATTKGDAMAGLLDELRPGFVLALGDDVSDAAAFRVLRDARAAGAADGLSLGVQARPVPSPEVVSAADASLASPREAARLLWRLATWPVG
ncbi:MAG: trehalose-phosphatase [Candidatus Limnocylindrales bacterium]